MKFSNSNIDPAEIAKFEAIAANWWQLDGEFQPLHELNPLRLQFIVDHVGAKSLSRTPLRDFSPSVLDVGCGGGILAEGLAQQGAKVTGIDQSPGALFAAKQHMQISQLQIDYQLISVEELASQKPHTFDVVTCFEMLEHVPDPSSIVEACSRLVKPGGHVFFSTLNRTLKAYLQAVIGAEYCLKLLPKGTHEYAKFIQPAELSKWARNNGLQMQELKGLSYNPFTKKYALCRSVDVNYIGVYINE